MAIQQVHIDYSTNLTTLSMKKFMSAYLQTLFLEPMADLKGRYLFITLQGIYFYYLILPDVKSVSGDEFEENIVSSESKPIIF